MAVIRISGYPGSGKTTLSKRLSEALGYDYHYTGSVFRKMAQERGLTVEEFYRQITSNPELEKSLDAVQAEIMNIKDNVIVEGRVAPFQKTPFRAINILLTVEPATGARRELIRPENKGRSVTEMVKATEERVASEGARYRSLYGIEDHLNARYFNIVIDTTKLSPDETFEKVMARLKELIS